MMIAFERRMEGGSGSLSINKDGGKLYASQAGIYMTKDVNSPTRSLFEVERSNSGERFVQGSFHSSDALPVGGNFGANEEAGNNNKVI